jgi:hypothetical protein
MPTLRNGKYEKFAQGITKGLSGVGAYLAAGYQATQMVNRNVVQIGFGRRPAKHQRVGVDEGQELPLLGRKAGLGSGET